MKAQTPVPDELIMFDRQFSWRVAWKVGGWWFVAVLISYLFDLHFRSVEQHWPLGQKLVVVAVEFTAVFLFYFDVVRWIRAMDELQRVLTLTIFLFAVSATFIFFMGWTYLNRIGFFDALWGPPPDGTWGIASIAHIGVLLGGFYGIGFLVFKRRYK